MLSILRCCTNRITLSIQRNVISRKYMTISEKMEILLKQRDYVERHYKLIYRDKNHTFVGVTYHTLNFMSCVTVATLGYLWYNDIPVKIKGSRSQHGRSPLDRVVIPFAVVGFFLFSYWIRQRFVLRVYFSEKLQNYRVIFIGRLPFTKEYKDFPAKSMKYVNRGSAMPWQQSLYQITNRRMFLWEDNFRTHSDFLNMLKPNQL